MCPQNCLLAAAVVQAITIDTVPVGNPGNAGELSGDGAGGWGPDRVCGTVGYAYNIGKYEVTAGQYTAFLTAVAATDTYGLYNTNMSNSSYGSGIARAGSAGSYAYSVDPAFVNRPVNYVSFWDACRFANWLNNGQQGAGTTEYGAYTLTSDGINNNTITRNTGAQWAVTSEDEWYKAAYYDPTTGTYFDYPTSSNTAPGQDMADPLPGNNANYYTFSGAYPIDSGKYTTVAGEFQNSDSPYGTFDQGGNVFEWNEAILYGSERGLRGGSFYGDGGTFYGVANLRAAGRDGNDLLGESFAIGFRVSEVPEPVTMATVGLGIAGLGGYIRRRMAR